MIKKTISRYCPFNVGYFITVFKRLFALLQADVNLKDGEDPAILLNSVLGFFFPVCYLPPAKVKLR
jgi:hypothetical protein